MFNKILVPYDGSEHAKHAVEAAIQLADTDKPVTITVLSIADVSNADDTTFEVAARLATTGATQMQTPADTMMEEREKEVAEEVAQIAPELPINVELKTIVKSGQPQSAI
ncbi:MAG: universal stress protein, partial [Eggerthellaceae bacterium]